ncbi:MAG: hypothetical protein V8T86_03340 [Victivallis sp.]
MPVSQVFHYHLLLGSEQLFDFFTAESAANAENLSRRPQPTDLVTLNVFDLADFYRKHKFTAGDALLCRVDDWCDGRVTAAFLPADDQKESDLKKWIAAYEKALDPVFDRFESYPEIPEQLAYACFTGAGELPEAGKWATLTTNSSAGPIRSRSISIRTTPFWRSGRPSRTTIRSSCRRASCFRAAKPVKSAPCCVRSVPR